MRRVFQIVAISAACAVTAAAGAFGETITGTLSTGGTSSSSPIDISSNTADWAYYGLHTYANNVAYADVKSGGPVSFSSATATKSTDTGANSWGISADSRTYLSFSGGSANTSGGSTNETVAAANKYIYASGSLTITHTLLASSEIVKFYLVNYASTVNLLATLSGSDASYSQTGIHLGYTDDNSHWSGILTLAVSGTVGETLTFTFSTNTRADAANGSMAIQAATVTTVPEPASAALAISGAIGLLAFAWRKRRK